MLNLYSHFAIDDQFERMAPSLVFFFMLVCRMVVDWQFDKIPEEKPEVKIRKIDKLRWANMLYFLVS